MSNEIKTKVMNRSDGMVGYNIPSLRVSRVWRRTGDILYITENELREALTIPGGRYIIENLLIIEDKGIRNKVLDKDIEPEYFYTEKEITEILQKSDSNQLLDYLEFAPIGGLDLIKTKAIEKLPNTVEKIEILNNKFDIDLQKIHALNEQKDKKSETKEKEKPARRSKPLKVSSDLIQSDENNEKKDTKSPYKNIVLK